MSSNSQSGSNSGGSSSNNGSGGGYNITSSGTNSQYVQDRDEADSMLIATGATTIPTPMGPPTTIPAMATLAMPVESENLTHRHG
ncbi:MAG: hypothetical protein M1820_006402 [Bogoriella megaspora]|nr:MAG: hypothetical protein M1820_006402 [Bogoriella megaspora]